MSHPPCRSPTWSISHQPGQKAPKAHHVQGLTVLQTIVLQEVASSTILDFQFLTKKKQETKRLYWHCKFLFPHQKEFYISPVKKCNKKDKTRKVKRWLFKIKKKHTLSSLTIVTAQLQASPFTTD